MRWPDRIAIAAAVVMVAGSCTPIRTPRGKSPLTPPRMSCDSVVLDIFFVRFPYGNDEANGPLWDEIDEQHLPADLRRELARNGFRAGVVRGQIPAALSQLLELGDKPPPTGQIAETNVQDLDTTPTVVRRHKQLRAGRPCEIQASDVYDKLPVVMCDPGGLCGRSYPNAQAMLVAKAQPDSGGRARLEVTPQVQYGEPHSRFVTTSGAMRLDLGRDSRVFDELAMSASLAAGDMLVLGSLDCRRGSLGQHFFVQEIDGCREQKLLVIRLSQTQHDDLFDREGVLPLETD